MSVLVGSPTEEPVVDGAGAATYRPYLDGLRAIAVYLVVLFHAGSDRFDSGYVGVDVFFVLSGYLVTLLLLRDVASAGSIGFRRFYARRFRRLLPAAFVVLVVTALVFTALASPVEVADAEDGFQASFLYVANWHFISESSDYFGADLATNPVLHFWSLAVEEQFYLLWPLLLGGLFLLTRRAGHRQRDVVRWVVIGAALGSVLWAWVLKSSDPNRAYYGTDTRAYQLLAGAAVALTPGLISRFVPHRQIARVVAAVAVVALVVVASSWLGFDAIERGVAVTLITVALIVALEAADGGIVQRALSLTPIVYLGKVSYGTYLWHWPVILVMDQAYDLSTTSTIALTTLIATALASLSYQLLEQPVRRSPRLDRFRAPVIVAGLTVSVVSALVLIPAITESPTSSSAQETAATPATGFTPVPPDLDFLAITNSFPDLTNCYDAPATDCTSIKGAGPHILLIGDSHAGMMIPTFEELARTQDLTLSVAVKGGCPWQRGLGSVPVAIYGVEITPEDCLRERNDLYDRVLPELDPDVIVVMNRGYEVSGQRVSYVRENGERVPTESPEYDALIDDSTRASLDELRAGSARVVVLEPIPYNPLDRSGPYACLASAEVTEECRVVVPTEPTGLEQLYRQLDEAEDDMWSTDLDTLVCPFLPICDPILDGIVVRIDRSHLSADFARALAPAIADYFTANGILP